MPKIIKRDYVRLKREAKKLFIMNGLYQKEIAQTLGISEKTISAWSKEHKWRVLDESDIRLDGGVYTLMKRFFNYVEAINPEQLPPFKSLWNSFLKEEDKSMGEM